MRRLAALILALALTAACAAPRAPEPAAPVATLAPAAPERAQAAKRPPRPAIPPAVLALLLGWDEGAAPLPAEVAMRERELTEPVHGSRSVGTFIAPESPRFVFIGRHQWLRADLCSAFTWCLAKFWWDIPSEADVDRRLVVQDLNGLTASVPEHPAPTHGSNLRWADVCYPTIGASNYTQPGARDPGLPFVSIWEGAEPKRLDCRRLFLWWELLARVFPEVSIETDARILAAVTTWAKARAIEPKRLAATMGRVFGDDLATALKYGHTGHMHLDLGDQVAWTALDSLAGQHVSALLQDDLALGNELLHAGPPFLELERQEPLVPFGDGHCFLAQVGRSVAIERESGRAVRPEIDAGANLTGLQMSEGVEK